MFTRVRAAAVLVSAVVTTAAMVVVPVASAVAAPPSTTAVDFEDDVGTIPAGAPFCAFPIERVLDGRLWTRTYTDDAGTVTREQRWVSAFSYTLRNPANGKELTSRLGGTVTTWFGAGRLDADGHRGERPQLHPAGQRATRRVRRAVRRGGPAGRDGHHRDADAELRGHGLPRGLRGAGLTASS